MFSNRKTILQRTNY